MKPNAIVYTSKTGYTREYALLLGERTALAVYPLDEALSALPGGCGVIYLGCLRASRVLGFSRAAKRFAIRAVCGVGLCDTGTLIPEVRKATAVPPEIPVFTLQGGLDRGRLKGPDKLLISMLAKGLAAQKQPTEQDARMLQLLSKDAGYVSEENLRDVLDWYRMKHR